VARFTDLVQIGAGDLARLPAHYRIQETPHLHSALNKQRDQTPNVRG